MTTKARRKFGEFPLKEFGNTVTISGVIYSNTERDFIIKFADEGPLAVEWIEIDCDAQDWQDLLRQTDMMETEVLAQAKDGTIVKAMLRKCTRQIEQGVSWNVFKRDGYACRYCGNDSVPLTVDHLVLWEEGGPSIEDNLVAACRKCNKARGNTQYADWLKSDFYKRVSKGLSPDTMLQNIVVVDRLAGIPRKYHVNSR